MNATLKRDDLVALVSRGETDDTRELSPQGRFCRAVERAQANLGRPLNGDELLTLRGLYMTSAELMDPWEDAHAALQKELQELVRGPLPREELLNKARDAVMRGREETYGSPESSFARIAGLWTAYKGVVFTPAEVAAMLALLKIARLANDPAHDDSWIDLAGYAANGYEVSRPKGGNHGQEP